MYCNIQKKPISEIVKQWEVAIDFSNNKIQQFYVLADSIESFEQFYHLLSRELGLLESGEFVLQDQSTSLHNQILGRLPLSNQNHSFTVKNFGDSFNAKPDEWYARGRFGHDYDQELKEGGGLKKALCGFEGKIVIFTWINTSNPLLVKTAMTSHFKDGAAAPTNLG
jgi:hypothetical protein